MNHEAVSVLNCKCRPDQYFCELVKKHFGESDIENKVDEYLKSHNDIVSDSSIIYHVFNTIRLTKFTGSFRETWNKAMSHASRFFPKNEDVEKFVTASLLKFAIAVRKDVLEGRGRNYWKKEMEAAMKVPGGVMDEAAKKEEILGAFFYALSA